MTGGIRRRLPLAAVLGMLVFAAAVSAQTPAESGADSSGRLLGRVLYRDQGVGIPYGSVTLTPSGVSRFADSTGSFAFVHLVPGLYHVRARQIGFSPFDTTVQVLPGPAVTTVTLSLRRVAIRLEKVVVHARGPKECIATGIPDSLVHPELAALFDQVRENVARLRILTTSYPFHFRRVEEFLEREPGYDDRRIDIDTVDIESWHDEAYEPGQVVFTAGGRYGQTAQFMHLVQFQDLANPTFEQTHCFWIAEADQPHDPHALVRIDFRPASALQEPDVEGSVYLDPDRYVVRHAEFHLTHPNEATPPLRDWTYYSWFREVVPLVPVVSVFRSFAQPARAPGVIENARMLDVVFIHEAPVDQSVRDTLAGGATVATIVGRVEFAPREGRPCEPPLSQTMVEALNLEVWAPKDVSADPSWPTTAKALLTDLRGRVQLPTTLDLTTFGYPIPVAAGGALRVAPGLFGRYAVSFGLRGAARDVDIVATTLSPTVDSVMTTALRSIASESLRGRTIVFALSTTPSSDPAGVAVAHIQVPSWLVSRRLTADTSARAPAGGADTVSVEFIVDQSGHAVLQTVHRIGADTDLLARPEMDGRVADATDSLAPLAFKPATVGQCAISEIATWRLLFRPR